MPVSEDRRGQRGHRRPGATVKERAPTLTGGGPASITTRTRSEVGQAPARANLTVPIPGVATSLVPGSADAS